MCGGGPEGEIQNGKCSVSGCCNWVFLTFIFQFFNKEHVLLFPAFGSLSSHPPPSGSLPYAGVLRALENPFRSRVQPRAPKPLVSLCESEHVQWSAVGSWPPLMPHLSNGAVWVRGHRCSRAQRELSWVQVGLGAWGGASSSVWFSEAVWVWLPSKRVTRSFGEAAEGASD